MQSENTAIYESQSDEQERRTCANAEEIGGVRHYHQESSSSAGGEKEESECAIYCFHHIETGRKYIGSSKNPNIRRNQHISSANKGSFNRFHKALREYGLDKFIFGIIEYCKNSIRQQREKYWIDEFLSCENGFNTHKDPTRASCYFVSDSTRRRMSESLKGKKRPAWIIAKMLAGGKAKGRTAEHQEKMRLANLGKKQPLEAIAKTAAANRGRKRSPETRARMSLGQKGRKNSPEARAKMSAAHRGRIRSLEHCKNLSAALRGKKKSPEHCAKLRGRIISDETRQKMSAAQSKRIHSPEAIAKTAAFNRGKKRPMESIIKTANANRGKKRSKEFCDKLKARWTPDVRAAASIREKQRILSSPTAQTILLLLSS
jgi:hypothetical protein